MTDRSNYETFETYEAILSNLSITPRRTMAAALVDLIRYSDPDHHGRPMGVLVRQMFGDPNQLPVKAACNKVRFLTFSEIEKGGAYTA